MKKLTPHQIKVRNHFKAIKYILIDPLMIYYVKYYLMIKKRK